MQSINERIGTSDNCHNPVLRWTPGNAIETIRVTSGLSPKEDGEEELDYNDPFAIWGDNGNPDMLDEPLTDAEWDSLLDCVDIK